MDSHVGRGILAVVAAIAVALVVFLASAAAAPAAIEQELAVVGEIEELVGGRLTAVAERQVELLRKLPQDVANGLFVDLPRKSRAFEAAESVKGPRAILIALTADFDALGAHLSGVVRGVSTIGSSAGDLVRQLLPGKGAGGVTMPRLTS